MSMTMLMPRFPNYLDGHLLICTNNIPIGHLDLASIGLDKDPLKTFFVFVFRRCLQDVLIKAKIIALVIHLYRTFSRGLQDVLIKENIFILVIYLQGIFKSFSRNLQDVLQKCLQEIFKTSWRRFEDILKTSSKRLQNVLQRFLPDMFKTFSRYIINLNCSS